MQLYLPHKRETNKDFLKEVLMGKKLLLKMNEVKPVNVPKYDELSLHHLLKNALEDPILKQYFPTKPIKSPF